MMISCPEEIALRMGYIDKEQFRYLAERMNNNEYGKYMLRILQEEFS
jgi:glucose-1-phosphate thymidylyltransferase